MSEPRDDRPGGDVDDELGRLLRLAGPRPAPSRDRARRVEAVVRSEWRAALRHRRQRFWAALGAVALAAAVVAGLALELHTSRAPLPVVAPAAVARVAKLDGASSLATSPADRRVLVTGETLVAGVTLETSAGSRLALTLAAGHSLRLDHETRLRLVSPSELALEAGAIYLDSGSGPVTRAVAVRTPEGVVRDVGTQFEVRLSASAVRIRVREGRVELTQGATTSEARAGEELRAQAGQITRASAPRHGADWGWILPLAPAFTLEGATLADFLAWSCRENGWTCRYARRVDEPSARTIVLHGSIAGLDPGQAMGAVLPAAGFTPRLANGVLVVERAGE